MLSMCRHCNLVSLIGYCDDSHEMALVYEYMLHGTLDDHLHKLAKSGDAPLSWVQRVKICIGAARELDYLHTGTSLQHRVIHRDVKSSNILLDENWAAKVSDFGLSKLGPANQSFSHPMSTLMSKAHWATWIHRRPAVDPRLNEEQVGLASWANRCVKGKKVDQIIDPYLKEEQLSSKSLRKFVKIADQCLSRDPEERPTMGEVMVCLEFALKLQESASSSLVEEMTFTKKMWLFFLGTTGMTYGISATRLRALTLKFKIYKMAPNAKMVDHVRKMSATIRDLKAAGNNLSNEQQILAVLRSLPNYWDQMKLTMMHNESIKTFTQLSHYLELEAVRQEAKDNVSMFVAEASERKGSTSKRKRQDKANQDGDGESHKRRRG
ncbi:hypothetical protein RJ640_011353 [Escallonia rubra]|uniref:Protein kinase domain-containing protein n=1 Tax=Escallonia rubra TaxID=112253 RepID=A0AA88QS04_9ASTE|nr:hypothetical protein RJ640_011353 [Escallonia rubra]